MLLFAFGVKSDSAKIPNSITEKLSFASENCKWYLLNEVLDSLYGKDKIVLKDVVYWLVEKYPSARARASMEYLTRICDPAYPLWIKKNLNNLTDNDIYNIVYPIYQFENRCYDALLVDLLFNYADTGNYDKKVNDAVTSLIIGHGTLKQTLEIYTWLTKKSSGSITPVNIYITQVRFKTPQTDKNVVKGLEELKNSEHLYSLIEFGLKEFNRYDFIGNLQKLRTILKPGKKQDNENINLIEETIIYLEQKKSENAPIGLPLNWPEENE
jgi:hypothetical protein